MIGELLGAAGSIAGSLLGKSSADKQAKLQKQFAQNAIQWKVEDAKKAGIHPLYAMGANTVSYSPTSVGDLGGSLGAAGQNIGRALEATQSTPQRATALAGHITGLQSEGLKLDNDIKRVELASHVGQLGQPGHPPGHPTPSTRWLLDGQGNAPTVDAPTIKRETKYDAAEPGSPGYTAGSTPGITPYNTPLGGFGVAKAPALAESLEDDATGNWIWQLQARILAPMMGQEYGPKVPKLPWQTTYFNPKLLQWEVRDRSGFPNRGYGRFNTRR